MNEIDENEVDLNKLKAESEKEAKRSKIKALSIILFVAVGARLLIKDPEPPKRPDHQTQQFKALPGMMDLIPEEELIRIDSKVLVQMQQADLAAQEASKPDDESWETETYKPAEEPVETFKALEEEEKEQLFKYLKKRRLREIKEKQIKEEIDRTKKMLVRLKDGGYLKAERTTRRKGYVRIKLDNSAVATIPKSFVKSISANAVNWKPPVPRGKVKLKPARGVTMVLSKSMAKRLRGYKKRSYES